MAFETQKTEAEIVAAAEKIAGSRMEVWTVGVADNVDLRREEHGRPTMWHFWTPESDDVANAVMEQLKAKGMQGYSGTDTGKGNLYITWA
ncbi:MAG: hypothetical protein QGI51_07155 [Dehalococcoidales bacterium]|jgi:hypothetical protein|nr:hypothetical protein [Dehalococcoidales bacterium]MDP6127954.1 hypothetical protein [Dehalococcoidales bacterium]MDP6633260.1 hypothetical protein [Dehalococcoidales bacterium]|tara:strand:- start:290 stop:559 length:270 start_codon:yes stop_codon:yes gene_type:complete